MKRISFILGLLFVIMTSYAQEAKHEGNYTSSTFSVVDTLYGVGYVIGSDYLIQDIIESPDGGVYIGGQFDVFEGQTAYDLVRLTNRYQIDNTFVNAAGGGGNMKDMAVQTDGRIVIAEYQGNTHSGVVASGLARIYSDGTVDASFMTNLGTSFDVTPQQVHIQSDGDILVGGDFNIFNGNTRNNLVRINSDGTEDAAFYTNLGTGFDGQVRSLTTLSDGSIIVGGAFSTLNGVSAGAIVKLNSDGTRNTAFDVGAGTGFDNKPMTMAVDASNNIYVGGQFTDYNGTGTNSIIKLNGLTGAIDATFVYGTGFDDNVKAIKILSGGGLLVGGAFTTYQGASHVGVVQLNTNGTVNSTLNIGTGFGGTEWQNGVHGLTEYQGNYLLGGNWDSYNGVSGTEDFIMLSPTGEVITPVNLFFKLDSSRVDIKANEFLVEAPSASFSSNLDVGNTLDVGQGVTVNTDQFIIEPSAAASGSLKGNDISFWTGSEISYGSRINIMNSGIGTDYASMNLTTRSQTGERRGLYLDGGTYWHPLGAIYMTSQNTSGGGTADMWMLMRDSINWFVNENRILGLDASGIYEITPTAPLQGRNYITRDYADIRYRPQKVLDSLIAYSLFRAGRYDLDSLGEIDVTTYDAEGVWTDGYQVYTATNGNAQTYTLAADGTFTLKSAPAGADFIDVWSDGTYVYFATGIDGITSYSQDGEGNVAWIDGDDQAGTGGKYRGIWGDGTFLYIAASYDGLRTYSVDGAGILTSIDNESPGAAPQFQVWGDDQFIYTAGQYGLCTYSVDGAGIITYNNRHPDACIDVCAGDGYIYSVGSSQGLYVFTVDGSGNLTLEDTDYIGTEPYQGVWYSRGTIYVSRGDEGIAMYSCLDGNLTYLGTVNTSSYKNYKRIHGTDSKLLVASGIWGTAAFDIVLPDLNIDGQSITFGPNFPVQIEGWENHTDTANNVATQGWVIANVPGGGTIPGANNDIVLSDGAGAAKVISGFTYSSGVLSMGDISPLVTNGTGFTPQLGNFNQTYLHAYYGVNDQVNIALRGSDLVGSSRVEFNIRDNGTLYPYFMLSDGMTLPAGITVGNSTTDVAGTIRWSGSAFEGYDGASWNSLGGGGSSYTFDGGLTESGGNVSLGGTYASDILIQSANGSSIAILSTLPDGTFGGFVIDQDFTAISVGKNMGLNGGARLRPSWNGTYAYNHFKILGYDATQYYITQDSTGMHLDYTPNTATWTDNYFITKGYADANYSYTFGSAITESGGTVDLGGDQTGDVEIYSKGNNFSIYAEDTYGDGVFVVNPGAAGFEIDFQGTTTGGDQITMTINHSGNQAIQMTQGTDLDGRVIFDGQGLSYGGDISSRNTSNNRWLIDKGYADTRYRAYTLGVQALTYNPADGVTRYFGMIPRAPTLTGGTSRVYIRRAGTITGAEIYGYSSTAGSGEAWSLYVRVNNTTNYLIATVSAATNGRVFSNTALNITVASGDYVEIVSVQPTWATNPNGTVFGGRIMVN